MAKASQPARLLDLHRFLGGLSVVFSAIHVAGLVADSYVSFSWMDILIPWAASWKPTAVAWGVVAMYLLVAVEITSLLMKRLPRSLWRQVHRASFGLHFFATIHGVQAGSDTRNVWYRMNMLASVNIVAFLSIVLILAHKKKVAIAPVPASIGRRAEPSAPWCRSRRSPHARQAMDSSKRSTIAAHERTLVASW